MGSFRPLSVGFLLIVICGLLAPPAAAQVPTNDVMLVTLPYEEARTFIETHPAAIGLGVNPESRDPLEFLSELGYGAPSAADISSSGTVPPRLADLLAGGVAISTGFGDRTPDPGSIGEALLNAFRATPSRSSVGGAGSLTVVALQRADEIERRLGMPPEAVHLLVIGIGDRTPVIVGSCSAPCPLGRAPDRLLADGITRRPGILSPYDIGATILSLTGVSHPRDFIGRALVSEPKRDAIDYLDSLERRLVRDASAGSSAAVVVDAITVLMLVLGILFVRIGMPGVGAPGAQGAWMAVAVGYPVSRFIASGSGTVRAIPVVAAFVLGAMLSSQRTRRNARIFFGIAIATALMFALAPLNPGGEPGLSIWGNPLTSWRFFGMQNAWAATIAAGIVVWGALAGFGTAALATVAAAIAVVMGAPTLGANFVGVLTFTFGATLAAFALARRKVEIIHVAIAGVTAVAAFFLALLADVGSPVSHGGRAAKRISDGGISTAWDFVTGRIRLNVDLIRGFWGGVVWVTLFIVALLLLARWGARIADGPLRARTAVWAGSMMALASLVLEDSGFFSGTTLLGAALAAWIVNAATVDRARLDPASAPGDG